MTHKGIGGLSASKYTRTGYLKAVWPGFLGAFLRSGLPRGPGKALRNVGAKPPTFLKAFPGPRGRPDLKIAPKKTWPDCFQVPSYVNGGCHESQGSRRDPDPQ